MFDTRAFNYYEGYILSMSVTEGLSELSKEEAGDYFKIIYLKSGTCHFLLNEKEFVMTGACAICMNELDKITFVNVEEDAAKILWFKPTVMNVHFTYDVFHNQGRILSQTEYQDLFYLRQFTIEAEATRKILSLHAIEASGIEMKYKGIHELLTNQNTSSWPCRSRSFLFEILFSLANQEEDENAFLNAMPYDVRPKLAVDVIYYLQSCYNQKITIDKLAEAFHTNRTTLINDFKKYTGQSINHYLIELRLIMASTLLRDTELSLEEICERTGFSDISYFSKVFKRKLKFTPSEYRKINT